MFTTTYPILFFVIYHFHVLVIIQIIVCINKIKIIIEMNSVTGLDSILERSIYKTERKNKYSFSKSKRFTDMKSTYTIDFYNKPVPRDTRTCSFGSGNKYFFIPSEKGPCSSQYNIESQKKVGVSFGLGREKVTAGDYLFETIKKFEYGQGNQSFTQYTPRTESLSKFRNAPIVTMSSKQPSDSFIQPNHNPNPQPSKYDTTMDRQGRVTLSNYKNTRKVIFAKSDRFIHNLQNSLISPNHYEVKDRIDSKNKSSKKNIFSMAAKKYFADDTIKSSHSPGPVYYVP